MNDQKHKRLLYRSTQWEPELRFSDRGTTIFRSSKEVLINDDGEASLKMLYGGDLP